LEETVSRALRIGGHAFDRDLVSRRVSWRVYDIVLADDEA
jgi:hypothetical protein